WHGLLRDRLELWRMESKARRGEVDQNDLQRSESGEAEASLVCGGGAGTEIHRNDRGINRRTQTSSAERASGGTAASVGAYRCDWAGSGAIERHESPRLRSLVG